MTWTPTHRTRLGVMLAIPLGMLLLFMSACLPAPVGDPEKSTVDPALNGAWTGEDATNKVLVLIRPWDTHTYFLQYFSVDKKPGGTDNGQINCKSWLTTLGGKTFIVSEPLQTYEYVPGAGAKPDRYWIVGKVERDHNAMTFRMINPDSEFVKGLTTREQLESAITANAGKDDLFNAPMVFKKVDKENAAILDDTLKKFYGH